MKRNSNRRSAPKHSDDSPTIPQELSADVCKHCAKDLVVNDRALFVEEEVGRVFCSEECIAGYFSPEIKKLEKEYLRRLSSRDLSTEERESLGHLRWKTLREPDEIWREKTISGDHRFTLISKFLPRQDKPVWCVCVCLFLRGEPSFLYIAFPTRNAALTNQYRRGERVSSEMGSTLEALPAAGRVSKQKVSGEARSTSQMHVVPKGSSLPLEFPARIPTESTSYGQDHSESRKEHEKGTSKDAASGGLSDRDKESTDVDAERPLPTDGLDTEWTSEELIEAQLAQLRSAGDIPREKFPQYQSCIEETLQGPDEVWSFLMDGIPVDRRVYHFIRYYPESDPLHWYIVIARDTETDEEIEILGSFPTQDEKLVEHYRTGTQEISAQAQTPWRKILH